MGLLVSLVLAIVVPGGLFAAIVRLWPERDNLTVEAAQRAVALLRETLEELSDELERALVKVAELQEKLEAAIERTHELEKLLEIERAHVAQLERRHDELDARHPE